MEKSPLLGFGPRTGELAAWSTGPGSKENSQLEAQRSGAGGRQMMPNELAARSQPDSKSQQLEQGTSNLTYGARSCGS